MVLEQNRRKRHGFIQISFQREKKKGRLRAAFQEMKPQLCGLNCGSRSYFNLSEKIFA
jgi:hypothetical protein